METWISSAILGLLIGTLSFLSKKQLTDIERSVERISEEGRIARKQINDRVDRLESKLQSTIEEMPYRYTLREDFIRAVTGLDAKLDKILDKVGGGN